jgi:hypothetical protein
MQEPNRFNVPDERRIKITERDLPSWLSSSICVLRAG